MPRFVILLFFPVLLPAQSLSDRLTEELCQCMTAAEEIIDSRAEADRCLREVAGENAREIRKEFRLDVTVAGDRRSLGELLIDPLTRRCPILQTLSPAEVEPEARYSDFPLAKKSGVNFFPKNPPPDPAATTPGEADPRPRISGTLLQRPGQNKLRVALPSGQEIEFEADTRTLGARSLSRGQQIELTYRREWQKGGDRIVLVVVELL